MLRTTLLSLVLCASGAPLFCQEASREAIDPIEAAKGQNPPEPATKRIFGIIPNYRTFPSLTNYKPLTPAEKFKIATQDAFDRGTVILGAAFGAEGLLNNSTPSFGHGAGGYAKYFAASFADYAIGDYMTEAVYPTLLHQDPRYFRRGTGSGLSRLGYAMGQMFYTYKDSGGRQFNYSEFAGNATAVAIGNAYYPDNRDVSSAASRFGVQIALDMAGNIIKEFSPDLIRKFSRKKSK